jgi:hypothetical protein
MRKVSWITGMDKPAQQQRRMLMKSMWSSVLRGVIDDDVAAVVNAVVIHKTYKNLKAHSGITRYYS